MAEFAPTEQLQQSVAERDVALTKQVVQAILNNNVYPDETARQAFEWAAERLPEMVQIHDPEDTPLEKDRDKWTADYYFDQKVVLRPNFSRERFMHLVDVRDHLRVAGHPDFQRQRVQAPRSTGSARPGRGVSSSRPVQQAPTQKSPQSGARGRRAGSRSNPGSSGCVVVIVGIIAIMALVGAAIARGIAGR